MILKEFQKRALATVEAFLERLTEWRGRAAAVLEQDPELDVDWGARAWAKTVPSRPYLPRRNGLGEPLPSFCLKITPAAARRCSRRR